MIKSISERDRIIVKNTIFNYGLRVFTYLFNFLSIPLSLNFLGKERYGIFETIFTLLSWASLANLGIGNGLRNNISYYMACDKLKEVRHLIGSAFSISVIIVSLFLIIGNIIIYFFIDFCWLFHNITIPLQEIKLGFAVSFSFFCFSLIFDLFSSIALGIHKSYISSLSKTLNLVLYTLFLFIVLKHQIQASLLVSAFIYGGATIIGYFLTAILIMKRKDIWPPVFSGNRRYHKKLLSLSMSFFVLQIASVILFSSDNFIISKFLGPNDVTSYSIINKVFFVVISLYSIILIQIWNSTSDAFAKKDFNWIKKTVTRLHVLLIPVVIVSMIIAVFFNRIVAIWLNQSFDYSLIVRLLFVLYVVIHCSNAIYVNILNGVNQLRWQTMVYIMAAIMNILISYYLINYQNVGYASVLYSKLICVFLTSVVCMYDYRKFLKLEKR